MAGTKVIVDTGPLVAYWSRTDEHHDWAVERWRALSQPVYTCEAVISETAFLLREDRLSGEPLWEALERDIVRVEFDFQSNQADLLHLLRKYADQPMSVADACLVRLAESSEQASVFTTDTDFRYYRQHGRELIPLITPFRT
jgi:predicted nucleic acid-binding protein